MGKISSDVLERIRKEVDILDVVGQYVNLKRGGRNYFGLCPFHSERTPSFTVAAHKQIYHCFGCGAGGDVIQFLMDVEQYTFQEAVLYLAKEKGIPIPEEVYAVSDEDQVMSKLRSVLTTATKLYHHFLLHTPYGREAREYLSNRKISLETIKTFEIGYAPPTECLIPFFKKRGVSIDLLVDVGLIVIPEDKTRSPYDRFRHRILFPISDPQGRVVGFGGRALAENGPKYLNSPETRLFQKRNHLFNLSRARKHIRKDGQAILMEGFMDVITLWQAGVFHGIAPLGTALTDTQTRLIGRNTDKITLCFDSDEAGQSATERSVELMKEHQLKVKIAQMPVGLDPDDFIRTRGAAAFREEVIGGSIPIAQFTLNRMKRNYKLTDDDDRLSYITAAIQFIASLPTATEQDLYARQLAGEFHLSLEAVKEELDKQKFPKKKSIQRDKEKVKWNNGNQTVSKHTLGNSPIETAEKYLVAHMIQNKQVAGWVEEELKDYHFKGDYGSFIPYLYAYYSQGNQAGFVPVIQSLQDSVLAKKITSLGMLDLPLEVNKDMIENLIDRIRKSDLVEAIKQQDKQVKQVENAGEPLKAAKLGLQVIEQLRKKQNLV
ncbi:DNA primase [Shimazuella kribbensis]|uniref:DNA primase n=1 Tax=Shimazuella kribbensis TaxID=139808 RepID=UPI00041030E0|nr:DNA primase [Shimazuella kribbensis]